MIMDLASLPSRPLLGTKLHKAAKMNLFGNVFLIVYLRATVSIILT